MNIKPMLNRQRLPAACLKIALALPVLLLGQARADDQTNAPQESDATSTTLGTVSVIGQGETRQVQRVTEQDTKVLAANWVASASACAVSICTISVTHWTA